MDAVLLEVSEICESFKSLWIYDGGCKYGMFVHLISLAANFYLCILLIVAQKKKKVYS